MSLAPPVRFAAIDVGSNAIRLVIGRVYNSDKKPPFLKREASYRVPLRLGDDVFREGAIPPAKVQQMVQVFQSFHHLLAFFAPVATHACATSAMREAVNGPAVVEQVLRATGIQLDIISGQREAELLFSNSFEEDGLDHNKPFLFIDVGGGSTEVTLMDKGKSLASESFRVGTVRSLQGMVAASELERMKSWVENMPHPVEPTKAIGTGGNIGKLFDMAEHSITEHSITRKVLKDTLEKIEALSYEERIEKLGLKPDRADVIVPAGKLYSQVMKWADIKEILVPKVGVSDGILQGLFVKFR